VKQVAGSAEDVERGREAVGLPRDQVEGPRRRRPELRRIVVVVQREMLGIIPQRRDGIAIEVGHYQRLAADTGRRRPGGADPGRKPIHLSVVVSALFGALIVSLIRGQCLSGRKPEWIGGGGAVGA